MEKSMGDYLDEKTGKHYEVIERTQVIEHKALNQNSNANGPKDYYTFCGIDLNPLDDECERFEMIQLDGTIRKINF